MNFLCPVCGYDGLEEPPYDIEGYPSYEICDCCGFEFGFDDKSNGNSFEDYRISWIKNPVWFNQELRPKEWDLKKQLININIKI